MGVLCTRCWDQVVLKKSLRYKIFDSERQVSREGVSRSRRRRGNNGLHVGLEKGKLFSKSSDLELEGFLGGFRGCQGS